MEIVVYILGIIFAASIGYLLVAIFCVLKFGRHLSGPPARPTERPGVTPRRFLPHVTPPGSGPFETHDNA